MLKPVINEPALLHGKTLVLGDLHLGYGHELSKAGISLPSEFSEAAEKIKKIIAKTGAKKIIFLGDVKHAVPSISPSEWMELPEFFRKLSRFKIRIVSGNHDGGIGMLAPREVGILDEIVEGDVVFTHGNRWISKKALKCKTIVMAHMHPVVRLEDALGKVYSEPVWVRGDVDKKNFEGRYSKKCSLKKFIIVPAFSPYLGGNPVNRPHTPIGPYIKNKMLDFADAKLYLLDGACLGTVRDLNG